MNKLSVWIILIKSLKKMKCFDQVSNYKIVFLRKIRRFQGEFKWKTQFSDRIRHFCAKKGRKNLVSNYKITIILKMRGFSGKFRFQPLFFDKICHIHEKKHYLLTKTLKKFRCQITKLFKTEKYAFYSANKMIFNYNNEKMWFWNKKCVKNEGVKLQNCCKW